MSHRRQRHEVPVCLRTDLHYQALRAGATSQSRLRKRRRVQASVRCDEVRECPRRFFWYPMGYIFHDPEVVRSGHVSPCAVRAHLGYHCPLATRSPPQAQVFSGPREYSGGALTRCPPGDQPGASGKVRGITGPGSSAQVTVEPGGGAVYISTMRVLLGRTPGRC
jgi:hypothetical protein